MARLTLGLIAANVLVFLFQSSFGTPLILTFVPALAFRMPWMFLTSIFLHGGIQHIMFNMVALFFFGTYLERMIGAKTFLALYFVSGIVGNVGYMFTAPNPLVPALGASGAVYGVMGTLAALRPLLMIFIYGLVPVPLIMATVLYALLDFAGLFTPSGIAHGAHLAGLLVGGATGLYIRSNWQRIAW